MLRQSFWAILAAASFSLMAAFVKLCNSAFGPLELVFYRSVITVFVMLGVASYHHYCLKPRHFSLHLRRDALGLFSVAIWFFTLGQLPLGTNITLTYTTSLFLALNFVILALLRKEKPPLGAIGSILLGFLGIVFVMRPTFSSGQEVACVLCLIVALTDLFIYWTVRKLGSLNEPSWRIVFYFALFCTIGSGIGTLFLEGGFHIPNLNSGLLVLAMGLFATAGMVCSTKAWVGGNMLLVSCLGFSAIPFSEIIGLTLFDHQASTYGLIGMALIVTAGVTPSLPPKNLKN